MPKPKRGSNVNREAGWRGVCPVCKRTGVKLLWGKTDENGASLKVCKHCGK